MRELLASHRQFVFFLAVGGATALLDAGGMAVPLGVNYLAAATASYVLALGFNYTLHARLTFRSEMSRATAARFLCLVALNYGLTLAFVGAAAALLGNPMPGKIAAVLLVPVNGYLLGKYWIFK
jgi:putative flippase GtrA